MSEKGIMGWRRAAAAVDGAPLDKVVQLGRPSLENRVGNVKAAQARLLKAVDEVRAARVDLAATVDALAVEVNGLDAGLAVKAMHVSNTALSDMVCGKDE